ncbi:MAG: hypothetical protein V4819_09895 [Verrucomicrobiota bacterium]
MKATLLIPPVAALVLVGAWNAVQLRSISSLETGSAALREKISTAIASGNIPAGSSSADRSNKATASGRKQPYDWKELSARLLEMETGGGRNDLRAGVNFQQELARMTKEEMTDALDEIARLNLSDDARETLESLIIGPLIKEDPKLALERFGDRIGTESSGIGWQLSTALRDWAKKDLAGATAWFDRQIADGRFDSKTLDGRSEERTRFEAALMQSLLASNPNAASQRLANIPEDQRREVLEQIAFPELGPQDQKNYAELVRQLVPQDERAGSFAHIASELVDESGYGKVSSFLDAVQATPDERSAAASQTAESRLQSLGLEGNVTRADVDSLREWLARQAPGQVDSITGKAIAEAAQGHGEFKFAEASQLVIQYQQSSGNDDMLVAFLQSYSARSNLEEAIHMADLITDKKRRTEIINQLK